MDIIQPKYPLAVRTIADDMTKVLAMPSDRWDEMLYWLNRAYESGLKEGQEDWCIDPFCNGDCG